MAELTNTEQRIYNVLAAHPGEFVSPETLLVEALQYQVAVGASKLMRVHAYHMRKKGIPVRGRFSAGGYTLAADMTSPLPRRHAPPKTETSQTCPRCRTTITVPTAGRLRMIRALGKAGWFRVYDERRQDSYWVCPECVTPLELAEYERAYDELNTWREARCG